TLRAHTWIRDGKFGKRYERAQKPIEEKESQRWIDGYRETCNFHCFLEITGFTITINPALTLFFFNRFLVNLENVMSAPKNLLKKKRVNAGLMVIVKPVISKKQWLMLNSFMWQIENQISMNYLLKV